MSSKTLKLSRLVIKILDFNFNYALRLIEFKLCLYLNSILGSVVVVVGMYVLLWGKSQDQHEACDELPKKMHKFHGQEIAN